MHRSPDMTELLTHADWVRRLARELVRDEHRVDDVVQETWVAAMRSPPGDSSNVRGWLAKVVRNIARGRGRADVRRIKREVEGARSKAVPPEHEVSERARLQHELAEHVLKLDEPYRVVLLLRYFDGLPPRTIAARLGIPVATVRTRHARGLEKLRERLTRDRGGAAEWTRELSALVAAGSAGGTAVGVWLGGVWMGVQSKTWAAAMAVVLALSGLWWSTHREPVDSARSLTMETASHDLDEPSLGDIGESSARQSVVSVEEPRPDAPAPTVASAVVSGRVVDTHGRPVPHARLVPLAVLGFGGLSVRSISPEALERHLHEADEKSERTEEARNALAVLDDPAAYIQVDSEGRFELLTTTDERPALVVWWRGWTNIANGWRSTSSGVDEFVVVIERSGTLRGQAVDESGEPVTGGSVWMTLSLPAVSTFPETLQRVDEFVAQGVRTLGKTPRRFVSPQGSSIDRSGRFELVGVPHVEGMRISAAVKGFERYLSPVVPADLAEAITLRLQRAIAPTAEVNITGRVLDAQGLGFPKAHVFFARMMTTTDETGAFRIRFARDAGFELSLTEQSDGGRRRHDIIATSKGFQPAVIEDFGPQLDDPAKCADVVLRLAPALSISGRVVDHEGRARPGVELLLMDPTLFGNISGSAEESASRTTTKAYADARFVTDAEGKFEVDGLRERDYRLFVIDLAGTLAIQSEPIRAGARDVLLREPEHPWHENVRGQVASNSGRSLKGVEVIVDFRLFRSNGVHFSRKLAPVQTDAEGRFELPLMPREGCVIGVRGSNVSWTSLSPSEYVPGREWRIAVAVNARFRVEFSTQEAAKEIGMLDRDGTPMRIEVLRADDAWMTYERVAAAVAASSVLTADDRAATLVLYGDNAEIRRMPIQLSADELTVLRP